MFRGLFYLVLLFLLVWGAYRYYEDRELPIVGGSFDDAATLASVKAALALHRDLAGRPISVRSRKGVVTLSGEVASDAERKEAEGIAASVVGIERIENLMAVNPDLFGQRVGEGRSLGQRLDDVSLAAKVKAALALHKDLKGADITVTARNGTVYLEGAVENREHEETATRRASAVIGVEKVESRLELDGRIDRIAGQVTKELSENENLSKYDLRATVIDGGIVLGGRVQTNAERELAELLAQRIAGSRDVINRIEPNER